MVSVRRSVHPLVRPSVRLCPGSFHAQEYVWVVSRPVYARLARMPFLPRLLPFVCKLSPPPPPRPFRGLSPRNGAPLPRGKMTEKTVGFSSAEPVIHLVGYQCYLRYQ